MRRLMMIAGHSGCTLELIGEGERGVIRKGTEDTGYAPRLRRQIEKQRDFGRWLKVPGISVPEVYSEQATGAGYAVEMEYCAAMDFVQFFLQSGRREIDEVVGKLVALVGACEERSCVQQVSGQTLQKKFWEVMGKLWRRAEEGATENSHRQPQTDTDRIGERTGGSGEFVGMSAGFLRRCEAWFARRLPGRLELPVGVCHGDLTFSNILIGAHRKQIVLLDFLDCFVESPLQDVVKLRQDTKYHWSFELCRREFDRTRLAMVMGYIDRKLERAFGDRPWYAEHYELFQFLNFLRILPYATKPRIVRHAVGAIEEIITGIGRGQSYPERDEIRSQKTQRSPRTTDVELMAFDP